jgi:magnesium chelatase family protein
VRGQHDAVKALLIAAAGGHNNLLSGPPGTGKTTLAQRLASILPPLSGPEAIEVTRIQHRRRDRGRAGEPSPFRVPHHSIRTAGLVGGARRGWVGELVPAHNGVLFLHKIPDAAWLFRRHVGSVLALHRVP